MCENNNSDVLSLELHLKATAAAEETQFLSWEMSLFEVDNNVTKILPSRCSINLAKQERLWNFEFINRF